MNSAALALVIGTLASFTSEAGAAPTGESSEQPLPPGVAVSWQVQNRFPLLTAPAFQAIEARWKCAASPSMVDLVLPKGVSTAQSAPMLTDGPCPSRTDKRFLLVDPGKGAEAKYQQELIAWARGAVDARTAVVSTDVTGTQHCSWRNPTVSSTEGNNSCSALVRIPEGQDTDVVVQTGAGEVHVHVWPHSVLIAALGDSYAAGEGSPDGPATYQGKTPVNSNDWIFKPELNKGPGNPIGEPVVWWDEVCHRSLLSWPVLASLRLALERPHEIVWLADVSCSGAEFFDGVFVAQEKPNALNVGPGISHVRDGIGPGFDRHRSSRYQYVPRSQINALRDVLCAPETGDNQPIEGLEGQANWRPCKTQLKSPDALLLSIGGNDIGFGPTVTGIIMPRKPQKHGFLLDALSLPQLSLSIARSLAEVQSVSDLTSRAEALQEKYLGYLTQTLAGTLTQPAKSILLTYPNPVGVDKDSCVRNQESRMRIRNSFMTLGPSLQIISPAFKSRLKGWVADFDDTEVEGFVGSAYPAIHRMQEVKPTNMRSVSWTAEGDQRFKGRLLCEEASPPDRSSEPYYFCMDVRVYGRRDECAYYDYHPKDAKMVDGEQRKSDLSDWNYAAENRRFVNSMNDAVLAQRRWVSSAPNANDVKDALSGALHPTPEAHAAAADSVYQELACQVLPAETDKREACPDKTSVAKQP